MPKIRWEEMFPDELLEAIARHPVCYLAYGLAEPHGAYNALGLDWLKAQALVERAAREHGGVVAPPFAWHIADRPECDWLGEHMGVSQPLTSAIPADLFLQMVLYQVRAIDARGFHVGILVTGHYGGLENDMRLLCEFYTRKTGSPIKLAAIADWEAIQYEDFAGDHGGLCETSQLMALRPELVDLSRKESDARPWAGMAFPTAGDKMPSAELGEAIIASQVRRLGEMQRELLSSYEQRPRWQAPSLTEVAALWNSFEKMTRKYWWCSLTLDELLSGKRVEFPGWDAVE